MRPHVLRKTVVSVAMVVTLGILGFVYYANGNEQEDAWLYLSSAFVILVALVPELFKKY